MSIKQKEKKTKLSTLTTKPRKDPKIEWNDEGYKAFIHSGGDPSEFQGDGFLRSHVIRFMNSIDLNHAPLVSRIQTMVREIGPDYTSEGELVDNKKHEWLTYTIDYSGRDSWKQKINSGSITEGKHTIIPQEQIVTWKLVNNTPVEQIETRNGDPLVKHTIPFEGKKTVDQIIKKHGNEDRKEDIVYTVKFTNPVIRCASYSYEQFTESNYEHCRYLMYRLGGPKEDFTKNKIDPTKLDLACKCEDCNKQVRK